MGVFLGEMLAGADGLGRLMAVAYRTLETPTMYVAIRAISLIGYALDRTLLLAGGCCRGAPTRASRTRVRR